MRTIISLVATLLLASPTLACPLDLDGNRLCSLMEPSVNYGVSDVPVLPPDGIGDPDPVIGGDEPAPDPQA